METPNTEEKKVTTNGENKEEPKKKKNIIRVYHAQNASDGGKKRRPASGEKRTRPAGNGQRRPAAKSAEAKAEVKTEVKTQPAKPEVKVEAKTQPAKPVEAAKPVETQAKAPEAAKPAAKAPEAVKPAAKVQEPAKPTETKAETPKAQTRPEQQARPAQAREGGFNRESNSSNNRTGSNNYRGSREGGYNRDNREGGYNRDNSNRAGSSSFRSRDGQNRTGDNTGRRFNQSRPGEGNNGGFRSRDGQNRTGDSNFRSRDGQNRTGDNTGRRFNQSRPGEGSNGGNRFNNQNRTDNRQGGMNKDNRFAGQNNRAGGAKPAGRRTSGGDASFAPELTKTSKDTRRERERENKNKKKDFEKTSQGGRRPNQNNMRPGQRLPKALQKPTPQPKQEEKKPEIKEITIPEKLTIRELADAMKMQPAVIVKKLFMQGEMVTVNSEIDFEKAEEIALEFEIIATQEEKVDVIGELLKDDEEEDPDTLVSRPPVVCVMGHVDHGKTSLLDAIRNTSVTRGEAGGITQHIGASVVSINGQKITFLDTPGHEAFTAMRMRGANSTDIAVLVVAADDGVMPQTVEAISHAKAAGVEIIVAVNKIDKPSANIDRVKQELSEHELVPDDWGGSTSFVPVSAKTGEGIDDLLEMILLTAEVSELKANPNRAVRGLVIEAQLDKGKGPVATILVQKGTLHVGDFIAAGACSGKVRAMMDDKGRRVKEAGPSTPVEILGLSDVPNAGEVLMSFESDKEAKSFAATFVSENKNRLLEETKAKLSLDNLFDQIHASDLKELPIIVKADVQGSVEAVKQSLTKLSNEEVVVRVIHGGVGAINESDVSLAATSNAIVIGFNVRPDATAKQLAEQEKVDLRLYKVIYQAIEDVESAMKGMLDPIFEEKVIGHAEIRQLFKASGVGTIAGSYILDGVFQRNCKVRISREGDQIFEGDLASLKRFKDDVKEVKAGYECGLVFDGFNDLKEEDKVEAYIMVEVPR